MAEEIKPQVTGFDDDDFERLVYDIDASRQALLRGQVPEFETPEDVVASYAKDREIRAEGLRRKRSC